MLPWDWVAINKRRQLRAQQPGLRGTLHRLAIGLISLGATARILGRQLDTSSGKALAGSYRVRMFIGIGSSEVAVLVAIITTFLFQDSLWLIVLGAALSLVGFWLAAPSKRNLARDQERLREQGSPLDLVTALNTPSEGGLSG
jgi:hypothetical protein